MKLNFIEKNHRIIPVVDESPSTGQGNVRHEDDNWIEDVLKCTVSSTKGEDTIMTLTVVISKEMIMDGPKKAKKEEENDNRIRKMQVANRDIIKRQLGDIGVKYKNRLQIACLIASEELGISVDELHAFRSYDGCPFITVETKKDE